MQMEKDIDQVRRVKRWASNQI